jgi:hypothetical protein
MSPYEIHSDKVGVKLSYVLRDTSRQAQESIEVISYAAYEKRAARNPLFRLRSGGGSGNSVLLYFNQLPEHWQKELALRFGPPAAAANPLTEFFDLSGMARQWYDGYQFADSSFLTPEQVSQYTVNASVLDAVDKLKKAREVSRKMRGTSLRGLWPSILEDLSQFNANLRSTYRVEHNLPTSRKLKQKYRQYLSEGYSAIVDGRARNQSALVVSGKMLQVWRDIYAGQATYKPDYTEIHRRYDAFLDGMIDIVIAETGELYSPKDTEFKRVSRQTIYKYQSSWEHRISAHSKRSGDRQQFMAQLPYHKLAPVKHAGTMISIDDRQPPFKNLKGQRIWFYNGIDLGSEAFTVWVHGETKEGIILDFYRQMVRNYTEWGLKLPLQLEAESSLNSSFKDTFLSPGAMFQTVRIEANNARGKRIEAFYRPLRYQYEKKREGWLARPHALAETNQAGPDKVPQIPTGEIVQGCLQDIFKWNNSLHSDQERYEGLTRWDVFLDHQNPKLDEYTYNWAGILSGLGFTTPSSMNAGRITLQGKHRVVGLKGEVALGAELINIMCRIEGKEVEVRWLDSSDGEVLKALVFQNGVQICELLDDLAYSRSEFERTPQCEINRRLMSAYKATVDSYIKNGRERINTVTIIERETAPAGSRFQMPGLKQYTPKHSPAEAMPLANNLDFDNENEAPSERFKTSTVTRYTN